jgi:hypothetical protein
LFHLSVRLLAKCPVEYAHRLAQIQQSGNLTASEQERQVFASGLVCAADHADERNLITNFEIGQGAAREHAHTLRQDNFSATRTATWIGSTITSPDHG